MANSTTRANVGTLRKLKSGSMLRLPKTFLSAFVCFAVTLVATWLASLGARLAVQELYDSGHYIETCRQMVLYLHQAIYGGNISCDINKLIQYVMLDGPVLPLLSGGVFLLLNKMPDAGDWAIFAGMQCVLQALSASLVMLLTYEFIGSRKWAIVAGVVWGLYPAALLATRVLMSETVTVVLLLSQLYLLSRLIRGKHIGGALGSGLIGGLVLLTKPALFASSLVVDVVALFNMTGARKRILAALILGLGVAMTMVPWLIFTKNCVGQVYLAPQRQPAFNIVKGCDIEADGLGGFPNTAASAMYGETDGAMNIFASIAASHPTELGNLVIRKVGRMFGLPWNDYRFKVFGLSAKTQALWHRLIWLLAAMGAITFCALLKVESANNKANFIGEASCLIVLGHLCYMLFEAIPRYGFTAVPFAVILAIYFAHSVISRRAVWRELALLAVSLLMVLISIDVDLIPYIAMLCDDTGNALWLGLIGQWLVFAWTAWLLWRIAKKMIPDTRSRWKLNACVLVFMSVTSVILMAHNLHGNTTREWRCVLKPGMVAERDIWLAQKDNPAWSLLLVDGEADLSSSKITVNGHELETPSSIYKFHPMKYQLVNVMQLQAATFGVQGEAMRQWRACHVPLAWLNLNGKNTITVTPKAASKVTVYGDYPALKGQRRYIPSFEFFSHGKLWNSVDSLDGRLMSPIALTDTKSDNRLIEQGALKKHDLSNGVGRQIGDYRLYLAVGKRIGNAIEPAVSTDRVPIATVFLNESLAASKVKDVTLEIDQKKALGSHLQVELSGQISGSANMPVTLVVIAERKDGQAPIVLPGTPAVVYAGQKWSDIKFTEVIPYASVAGGIGRVRLQIYGPGRVGSEGTISVHNLKLNVSSVDRPSLAGHWLGIY